MLALYIFVFVCWIGSPSTSFYLPARDSLPQYYPQQQFQRGFWPSSGGYDSDQGLRYHQSFQNSYQQNLEYNGYPNYRHHTPEYTPYQNTLSHQSPHVYQLIAIGPEVPVLVRLPDQRTTILPARSVYSLPGFLEGIVQNIQNYYSVFNPLEVLKVQRNNATILFAGAPPSSSTVKPDTASEEPSTSASPGDDQSPTTPEDDVSNTDEPATTEAAETTTAASTEAPTE